MIALLAAATAYARPPLSHEPDPVIPAADESTPAPADTPAPAPAPAPKADPLYDQLLGGPAAASAPAPSPAALATWSGLWPLGLAAVGAGAVWLATRKRVARAADSVTVLARTALGTSQAGVVVIEVQDATGKARRLLLGTGGSGAPTLLADLGEEEPVEIEEAPAAPQPRRSGLSVYSAAAEERPVFAAGARQKADAMALIGEVVEARRNGSGGLAQAARR
jgi:hypothetical protein